MYEEGEVGHSNTQEVIEMRWSDAIGRKEQAQLVLPILK